MNKQDIVTALKTVNYPGFDRNIVDFGMVKEINFEKGLLSISLEVATQKNDVIQALRSQITKLYSDNKDVEQVAVKIQQPEKNENSVVTKPIENLNVRNKIPGIKHIIAVASGKGGVGKSTVALNLATALSKEYKVGILDLDIYGPSLPMLVGSVERPVITPDRKIIPIEKFGMKLMSFGFISGNETPTIWRGPMVAKMTEQFFEDVLWGELDYLILDLPPGTGDVQLTLVQKIFMTGAVVITTPQDLALIDVQKSTDMFRKVDTPVLGIVENMSHFLCPHCENITEIFSQGGGEKESKRLNVPLLGQIYLTPEIALSADNGTPYVMKYPDSPITKIYTQIAEKITQ